MEITVLQRSKECDKISSTNVRIKYAVSTRCSNDGDGSDECDEFPFGDPNKRPVYNAPVAAQCVCLVARGPIFFCIKLQLQFLLYQSQYLQKDASTAIVIGKEWKQAKRADESAGNCGRAIERTMPWDCSFNDEPFILLVTARSWMAWDLASEQWLVRNFGLPVFICCGTDIYYGL